jgi:hypothetical protein
MIIELDRRFYNSTDNFYSPDWWDKWQEGNFKRKVKSFSRRLEQQEE